MFQESRQATERTDRASHDWNRTPRTLEGETRRALEPADFKKASTRIPHFETEVYVDVLSAYGHYDDK